MNRLATETSPYLLQHTDNPVDWYSWGEEALERARREDRPILLSIGYAACHGCHLMERESFEDPETAELMNRHFVSIKVEPIAVPVRERERPAAARRPGRPEPWGQAGGRERARRGSTAQGVPCSSVVWWRSLRRSFVL